MNINERCLELFWYWICEREAVRIRKEGGEDHPWSQDHIFNTYHFCNVRRQDDRGTKEIQGIVKKLVKNDDMLPQVYTMARMFNSVGTVERVLRNPARWVDEVKEYRAQGNKVFHTAYLVSTCGVSMDKVDYVAEVARQVGKLVVPRRGLGAAHAVLTSCNGLGSFLAAQVVADLRNDRYLEAKDFTEAKYWSSWGPGSKKGLDLIFGPGTTPTTYQSRMTWLFENQPFDVAKMDIHGQDLQNCLCEFSKYMRHKDNLGGRNRYYEGK